MASAEKPTWFLIANDCPIMRLGFKEFLRLTYPLAQVTEAANGPEVIDQVARQSWDCVLLELYLKGRSAIDLLDDLKFANQQSPILLFTAPQDGTYAIRALKSGCQGVVCKSAPIAELGRAIEKLVAGERYLDAKLQADLISFVATPQQDSAPHNRLSNREFEIMTQMLSGRRVKEIAAELSLSQKTVFTLRSRVFKKLNVDSDMKLARYATRHSLLR